MNVPGPIGSACVPAPDKLGDRVPFYLDCGKIKRKVVTFDAIAPCECDSSGGLFETTVCEDFADARDEGWPCRQQNGTLGTVRYVVTERNGDGAAAAGETQCFTTEEIDDFAPGDLFVSCEVDPSQNTCPISS